MEKDIHLKEISKSIVVSQISIYLTKVSGYGALLQIRIRLQLSDYNYHNAVIGSVYKPT